LTKSSIVGRPRGGRKQGDAAAAEAPEQVGFAFLTGGMSAKAVVETARDQQALYGRGRRPEQRGAQGAQGGGEAGFSELVAAQTEDRRPFSFPARADEALDGLDPAGLRHGAAPHEQQPRRSRILRACCLLR